MEAAARVRRNACFQLSLRAETPLKRAQQKEGQDLCRRRSREGEAQLLGQPLEDPEGADVGRDGVATRARKLLCMSLYEPKATTISVWLATFVSVRVFVIEKEKGARGHHGLQD